MGAKVREDMLTSSSALSLVPKSSGGSTDEETEPQEGRDFSKLVG